MSIRNHLLSAAVSAAIALTWLTIPTAADPTQVTVERNEEGISKSYAESTDVDLYWELGPNNELICHDPVRNLYVYNALDGVFIPDKVNEYGWTSTFRDGETHTVGPMLVGTEQISAFEIAASIYDFYEDVLGIDGFNGFGGPLYLYINADYDEHAAAFDKMTNYNYYIGNVFFDDFKQAHTFCFVPQSGWINFYRGTNWNSKGTSTWENKDTLAHEYTHAVINSVLMKGKKRIDSKGTGFGAIQEAYSDIFAQLYLAWESGENPDWGDNDDPTIRNAKNPKKDQYHKNQLAYYSKSAADAESHQAATILSHAMYLTWVDWKLAGLSIDETVRDMARLLYRSAERMNTNFTYADLGPVMVQESYEMVDDGILTAEQSHFLILALDRVGIPSEATTVSHDHCDPGLLLWEAEMAEIVLSAVETDDLSDDGKLGANGRDLALSRLASIYDASGSNLNAVTRSHWEKSDHELTSDHESLVRFEEMFFGTETLFNDRVLSEPEKLVWFAPLDSNQSGAQTFRIDFDELQTAESLGYHGEIHSISRDKEAITVSGSVAGDHGEIEYSALFKRGNAIFQGEFFYGYHLEKLTIESANIMPASSQDENMDDDTPVQDTDNPDTDGSDTDTYFGDFETYVQEVLIPERGEMTRNTLTTTAMPMSPVTEWTILDIDGLLGWQVADYDGDGQDELLVSDAQMSVGIAIRMYEREKETGLIYQADEREFNLPLSYITLYNLTTTCFTYPGEAGTVIGLECHYSVNERVSAVTLYTYNGSSFEWFGGMGYQEQGQGDVIVYEGIFEPMMETGLDVKSFSLNPKVSGWMSALYYMTEQHNYANLPIEEELADYYIPYQAIAENLGLIVNDTRLLVAGEAYDPMDDYAEYNNRQANIETRDVYASLITGEPVNIIGGLHMKYLINENSSLERITE